MKAPDKIYVHVRTNPIPSITFSESIEKNSSNEEYIRKNTLLKWMKEKQEQMKIEASGCSNMLAAGKLLAFKELIEKIKEL